MRPLPDCRLYGILDLGYVDPRDALPITERMIDGGIDILQLRAKDATLAEIESLARRMHALTCPAGVPLIINDHPRVAAETGAEGVHVGQDDASIADVKQIVPPGCMIGKSTHSRAQALDAEAEGADYIGFGPLFATPTKPDYTPVGTGDIAWVHRRIRIPVFCIGGIKRENVHTVIDAGARRVVIVSGILQAPDIPQYIGNVKKLLESVQH